MKNKKITTVALIIAAFIALFGLSQLESEFIPEYATGPEPYIVPATPPTLAGIPAVETTNEEIAQTLTPEFNGCTIDQAALEVILTHVNNIFNNSITLAQIIQGTPDNPNKIPNKDIDALMANNVMPQDSSFTCKVLRERLDYLDRLTTVLATAIYYAIPSRIT